MHTPLRSRNGSAWLPSVFVAVLVPVFLPLLLIGAPLAVGAPAAALEPPAAIAVSPTVAPFGATVTVSGEGCTDPIEIGFGGQAAGGQQFPADPDGSWSVEAKVAFTAIAGGGPDGVNHPGTVAVAARCAAPDAGFDYPTASLDITPAAEGTGTFTLSAASAALGSSVSIATAPAGAYVPMLFGPGWSYPTEQPPGSGSFGLVGPGGSIPVPLGLVPGDYHVVLFTHPTGERFPEVILTAPLTVTFGDIPVGTPFYDDMAWLARTRVAAGYPDGTYHPTAPVTRQAMAAFLYRFGVKPALQPAPAAPTCDSPPYPDVPVDAPFCGEIAWMKAQGIAAGYPDGSFHPRDPVRRHAMAAFLYRLDGLPTGDDPTCVTMPFADVPTDAPFCGEISWLKQTGLSNGYPDGTYHVADVITRQAIAAFLHRYNGRLVLPQTISVGPTGFVQLVACQATDGIHLVGTYEDLAAEGSWRIQLHGQSDSTDIGTGAAGTFPDFGADLMAVIPGVAADHGLLVSYDLRDNAAPTTVVGGPTRARPVAICLLT